MEYLVELPTGMRGTQSQRKQTRVRAVQRDACGKKTKARPKVE